MRRPRRTLPIKPDRRRRPLKPGFTLLEVILALAILAGAIAMLTEGVRSARRNGQIAAQLTNAQLIAVSKMSELTAQVTPLASVSNAPCETDPNFFYTITTGTAPVSGLVAVTVTVQTEIPGRPQPLEYSLVRWLPDPGLGTTSSDSTETTDSAESNASE